MEKKDRKTYWRSGKSNADIKLAERVEIALGRAKFKVIKASDGVFGDVLATYDDFGRERRYLIEINAALKPEDADRAFNYWLNNAIHPRSPTEPDELWFVTEDRDFNRRHFSGHPSFQRALRLLDLKTLTEILAGATRSRSSPAKKNKAKTQVGRAIQAHEQQIQLAIAGLLLQIDHKLEILQAARPNSVKSIAERDAQISEYEKMRAELDRIRALVAAFTRGEVNETAVVRTVDAFAGGVRSWWNKGHDSICSKAFDMGLFASCVGICSMAGAGGKMAITVSAALVGGKSVAGALKGLAKKFTD